MIVSNCKILKIEKENQKIRFLLKSKNEKEFSIYVNLNSDKSKQYAEDILSKLLWYVNDSFKKVKTLMTCDEKIETLNTFNNKLENIKIGFIEQKYKDRVYLKKCFIFENN